jgi:hypothetical protein
VSVPRTTVFDADVVTGWRRAARQSWLDQWCAAPPEGWSVSRLDLGRLVTAFDRLRLAPDHALRAYQHRQRNDGRAVAYAVPAEAALPPVDPTAREPPAPASALPDLMDAIEGDGSPESHLQASILRREIAEAGAFGHGSTWQLHHVLGRDAWTGPQREGTSPAESSPSRSSEGYEWSASPPDDYRPTVEADGAVLVRFHTYVGVGAERIVRHEDVYATPGRYAADTHSEILATGPSGYLL